MTRVVHLTNDGSTSLTVQAPALSGADAASFSASATGLPATIAPGEVRDVAVTFAPPSAGERAALMTVPTSGGSYVVGLYGLGTKAAEGVNEPTFAAIARTLGYTGVNVGGQGLLLPTVDAPIGDEVAAAMFRPLPGVQPEVSFVARYSPAETMTFGWYRPDGADLERHPAGSVASSDYQTLLPRVNPSAEGRTVTSTTPFGLYVTPPSFNRSFYTETRLNVGAPVLHATRTYPVRNRSGAVVPNSYFVGFEPSSNGDYQDYVLRIDGVEAFTPVQLARVDFTGATAASGYVADMGSPFDAAVGSGWVRPGTTTPVSMTSNTRTRSTPSDVRLQTVMVMQGNGSASQPNVGAWERIVPNGSYQVTVAVGDSGFYDSVHGVDVEGVHLVSGFVPNATTPFRTSTVQVDVTDGRVTLSPTGTNTKIAYVDIDSYTPVADSTPPKVAATITGQKLADGTSYNGSATVAVAASDEIGLAQVTYAVDGEVSASYTSPVVVSGVGTHTVLARATDIAGNVATSSVTFTVGAFVAGTGKVTLENADKVPYADRLLMSRIQNPETGTTLKPDGTCCIPANVVHDKSIARIRNSGTGPLNITSLQVTGPFQLVTPPTLPSAIAVGASKDVTVRFIGTAGPVANGTLVIGSDDAQKPSRTVELAGVWQEASEKNTEVTLENLVKAVGYGTSIRTSGESLTHQGHVEASGEEVLSAYWTRADAGKPVVASQLSAFHGQGNVATLAWFLRGSTSTTNLMTMQGTDGQTVLPRLRSSNALAAASFSPSGVFGIKVDGESSDPTRNSHTKDKAAGCVEPCGHHVRFWPVRDRSGGIVAGSFLMTMDYSGVNYDYNDNTYVLTNIKPANAPDPATPDVAPGAVRAVLPFTVPVASTVADGVGVGTGFTSVQRNKLDGATDNVNSYRADLLSLTDGQLNLTTYGTATAGSNSNGDNTLVNGLQLGVDAALERFTVRSHVTTPTSAFTSGFRQAGVSFGRSDDEFVKLVVGAVSGVPTVQLQAEVGGALTTLGSVAVGTDADAVDLMLVGDPATGRFTGSFRLRNAGTWGGVTVVPGGFSPSAATSGRWFERRALAGVVASSKGSTPFTASFDDFGVVPGDAAAPLDSLDLFSRIDVGASSASVDGAGRTWAPDTGLYTPSNAIAEGGTTVVDVSGTASDLAYTTYRGNVGTVSQSTRTFALKIPMGSVSNVGVRLHYAERFTGNGAAGKRVQAVSVEGRVLRQDFDVYSSAGGIDSAVVLEATNVPVGDDGKLTISSTSGIDQPSLNGVEVFCTFGCQPDATPPSAPTALSSQITGSQVALTWTASPQNDVAGYDVFRTVGGGQRTLVAGGVTATSVTDNPPPDVDLTYEVRAVDLAGNTSAFSAPLQVAAVSRSLQQPVRINAGGGAITSGDVTWQACDAATTCSGWVTGGKRFRPTSIPAITGVTAPATAAMLQDVWTGGVKDGIAPGAVGFAFHVPVSYGNYVVRLHFAELTLNAPGQRLFDVDVEGGSPEITGLDLVAVSGARGKAFTRDIAATVTDGVLDLSFIAEVENASVNAIEILPAP